MGDIVAWSDTDHLLATLADRVGYQAWMFARANFKDIPKRPPNPMRRPGDATSVDGEGASRNLEERELVASAALSIDEMNRAIEEQTGRTVITVGLSGEEVR